MIRVADLSNGSKKRIGGLSLRATDANWSTGAGSRVSGTVLALLMATTGRKQALADLTGDGVASLQSRP